MSESDILGYPGRYILEDVYLTGFDGKEIKITELVSLVTYTEDIFSPCVYGACVITDALDIHQFLPICGEETIRIIYTSSPQDPEISKTFTVYKSSDKKTVSNTSEQHVLHFCSTELVKSLQSKVSKAYTNKKPNQIVESIYNEFLEDGKEIALDDSLEAHDIIIPNISPFEAIQFCTTFSKSSNSNGALFTFYEDKDGFRFANIEDLLSQEPLIDTSIQVRMQNVSTLDRSQLFPSTSFASFVVSTSSKDILNNSMDGVFANTVLSYDPLTKQFASDSYDYETDFERVQTLDRFKLSSTQYTIPSANQRVSVIPTQSLRRDSKYYNDNSKGSIYPLSNKIVSFRTAQLGQLDTIKVSGTLYGLTRVTAGKTILLDVPNHTQLEAKKNEPNHKYLSGKYLIKSCTHNLGVGTYTIDVELMKDSLYSELESSLD